MKSIYETFKPTGFHNVNSYLFAEDPVGLIDFLKGAFQAEEINRTLMDNGDIANVILRLGDSCLMISQARDQFIGMKSSFYLFVNDTDSVHKTALECGAKEEIPPMDMDYGDRQSGVIDTEGNYWWISQRLVKEDYSD